MVSSQTLLDAWLCIVFFFFYPKLKLIYFILKMQNMYINKLSINLNIIKLFLYLKNI